VKVRRGLDDPDVELFWRRAREAAQVILNAE
jgi:hypothetical protein